MRRMPYAKVGIKGGEARSKSDRFGLKGDMVAYLLAFNRIRRGLVLEMSGL